MTRETVINELLIMAEELNTEYNERTAMKFHNTYLMWNAEHPEDEIFVCDCMGRYEVRF